MSQNQTPEQVAAANVARRDRTKKLDALVQRCRDAQTDYTGESAIGIRISPEEAGFVDEVRTRLAGWTFYASQGGKLYMGSEAEIARQRILEGEVLMPQVVDPVEKVTPPPVVEKVTPPAVEKVTPPPVVEKVTPPPGEKVVPAATGHTFAVLGVERRKERLKTVPAKDVLQKVLKLEVEACSVGGKELGQPYGFHALMESVHVAFARHYGLVLSPDVVWTTIAQGFARLVNREPEKFRGKFVLHEGKQQIEIIRNGFTKGNPDNDWAGCFNEFGAAIGQQIGADNHGVVVSDFSTTGPLEQAVSNLVLMDTVQQYFSYKVSTLCGIPFVTLRGTVADWKKVVAKTEALRTFGDLSFWLDDLVPILRKVVAAAEGKPDLDFWNSIYKAKSESGGTKLTGWIVKLLPLTKDWKGNDVVNPLLGKQLTPPHRLKERPKWSYRDDDDVEDLDYRLHGTVNTAQLPASLSTVPFVWNYLGTKLDYKFVGGIVGYSQNDADLAICPQMGWAVLPANAKPYSDPNSRW